MSLKSINQSKMWIHLIHNWIKRFDKEGDDVEK